MKEIDFIFGEPFIYKKEKYTIRMDVTFDKGISQEEAERRVYGALRSVGVIGHCGGIN